MSDPNACMCIMATRLVIFDFDGTLGDTRQNIVMTMQQVMRRLGLAVADERTCAATIGLPLADCFRRIYDGMDAREAERCAEAYRQFFFANAKRLVPQPFPHVLETMGALARKGVAMAIASSRTSRSLEGFVTDMGFRRYIGYVVGCEDVAHPKPHPEPVIRVLEALHFAPEEAMVVGDMPVDIMMGAAAGVCTCAVTYGNGTREELSAAQPDFMIDSLAELFGLLQ